MSSAIEQSVKEKLRFLASERGLPFSYLWQSLILERFLARLSHSTYKDHFVLKGGTLLSKYLPLGRETKDLDFCIQKLPNNVDPLKSILISICEININDSFLFELNAIDKLEHPHMPYTGSQINILAKFGGTKTPFQIDLGYGDVVKPIEHQISLTATPRGPLFESAISLCCYPQEFIFAEKLETIVFRGASNTRMKDFHDLHSLIALGSLNTRDLGNAVKLVFEHRKTPLSSLPLFFDTAEYLQLEKAWSLYCLKLKNSNNLPTSIKILVEFINNYIEIVVKT